jgi:hypothetical protein
LSQRNTANDDEKGILPLSARPAAMPAMFASAIPTVKKRSGNSLANFTL